MKEITILSGKGGTGKTSLTAALATIVPKAVLCDNDVDAPDLHLVLSPKIKHTNVFESAWIPKIDIEECSNCNMCIEYCRFDAIKTNSEGFPEINPFQCEGCRLCERVCPQNAIKSTRNANNFWYISDAKFGSLIHARMSPGEENSGKLVSLLRKKAKEHATQNNLDFIINDGAPGVGCPVISSLTGTDYVIVIIEPSLSGLHDLKRLIELINSFKIPFGVIINKADISLEITQKIELFLIENNYELLEKLPFDSLVVEAMVKKKTITEHEPESVIGKKINNIWEKVSGKI